MAGSTRSSATHPEATPTGRGGRRNTLGQALWGLTGAAALVAGTALSAYGKHEPVAAPRDISGTYALNTMAGAPVPAVLLDSTLTDPSGDRTRLTIVVAGGRVTLTRHGSYTVRLRYQVSLDGHAEPVHVLTETGSYAATGAIVTFALPGGDVTTGTISDGELDVTRDLLDTPALKRWYIGNSGAAAAP